MGFLAFLILLALMAAARVAELLVARRHTQAADTRGEKPKREPAFVAMVLVHVLTFLLPPVEVILFDRPFVPALFIACTAALLALALMRVWTLRTLGKRWNVRIVRPDAVVVAGPYRFIRHPNYAIVIAELFILPLAHTAYLSCATITLLNALVLWRRIPAEERVLFSLPGYADAMQKKARFVPHVF